MSTEEFGAVDIDLLADYVGGALSGDEEARVARLVADDPAWREAHALLAPGMDAVASGLRDLGSAPEPMPDDVVARVNAALDARSHLSVVPDGRAALSAPQDEPGAVSAAQDEPGAVSAPQDEPGAVSAPQDEPAALSAAQDEPVTDRPHRSAVRRWLRVAAPIAAAAGVLAFAGFGADYLTSGGSADVATNSSAGGGSAERADPMIAADAAGLVTGLTDDLIQASGSDYDRATLVAPLPAAGAKVVPEQSDDLRKSASLAPQARAGMAPDPGFPQLQRLRARDALVACLEAIATAQGSGPITVHSVDYARYRGRPALIVQFAAGGISYAWAAGPDCGTQPSGADPVDRVRVG